MERRPRSEVNRFALLLIDVINDLDFDDGELLLEHALPMARKIRALKQRARERDVPVIYVNDNFGRWRSDFQAQVDHCSRAESRGKEITKMLPPDREDYFVLKPKHSGFFSTTLDILLSHLDCGSLILTGVATNICVLFTANDAYMRDFRLFVPSDCSAANTLEEHHNALAQMERALKADIRPSPELDI